MNLLAYYNFKLPGCQLNFLRIALLATILSSKRHQDGISKLVFKSDFDKLKGKSSTKIAGQGLAIMPEGSRPGAW